MLTLNMQAPKASDSPQHKKRGTAADLRIRLSQDWPRVGTASPPKRENILTPQKATYKGGKARFSSVVSGGPQIRLSVSPTLNIHDLFSTGSESPLQSGARWRRMALSSNSTFARAQCINRKGIPIREE